MKFETIRNKKKTITLTVIGLLLGATIILSVSLAKYMTTKSVTIAEGNINYIIPDMKIVAIQVENDEGEYVSSNTIPMGYALNADSYCEYYDTETKTNVRTGTIKYEDKLTIEGLTNRNSKCYLKFDKLEAKTISEIIASKTIYDGEEYAGPYDFDTTDMLFEQFYDWTGHTGYHYAGNPGNNNLRFAGYNWHIISYHPDEYNPNKKMDEYRIRIMLNEDIAGDEISADEIDPIYGEEDMFFDSNSLLQIVWKNRLSNYANYIAGYNNNGYNMYCFEYHPVNWDGNIETVHEFEFLLKDTSEGAIWDTAGGIYKEIFDFDAYGFGTGCTGSSSDDPIGLIHSGELWLAGHDIGGQYSTFLSRNFDYMTLTQSTYTRYFIQDRDLDEDYLEFGVPAVYENYILTANNTISTASRAHYYPVITLYNYKNNSELLLAGSGTEEDPYTIVENNS